MEQNSPQLAQWYIERGEDEKTFAWSTLIALLVCVPPVAILWIPFAIWKSRQGKKKIAIGEAMNEEAGRPNIQRPLSAPQGVVPQFTSRPMPPANARFQPVPLHPPV